MQQVQKESDANKFWVKLLIVFSLLPLAGKSYAQEKDFDFQKNFVKTFKYPDALKQSCVSTYTNILIEMGDGGKVVSLSVSDSAPQLFKDEFEKIKVSLKFELLNSILKDNKAHYYILPVFYVYQSDYCVNSFEAPGYLSENYYSFDGHQLNKEAYTLKPIINTLYKPLH
ncbi:hypothetical protein [Mucilaginibacter sp. KACC 22063]|uniref:hypothetical protein n=1 Tax=Mucilaginibacter sp. KACC 22063 TaxID=3025666 RepID=UPI0023651BF9|nr:hypothetical protein [Mucilaginibacter sp. KACC 22063]WDF55558.1 hypothetical protein PQ461_00610 [Mucilaginibacter sp. KACC 22063]